MYTAVELYWLIRLQTSQSYYKWALNRALDKEGWFYHASFRGQRRNGHAWVCLMWFLATYCVLTKPLSTLRFIRPNIEGLTLEISPLETLYGCQLTLSTQLMKKKMILWCQSPSPYSNSTAPQFLWKRTLYFFPVFSNQFFCLPVCFLSMQKG